MNTKSLLSVCDEYVYSLNGKYYLREFGKDLIYRYLNVFESIVFAVRVKQVASKKELQMYTIVIDDNRVKIEPVPFFRGPIQFSKFFFQILFLFKRVVKQCDTAIFRLPSAIGFLAARQAIKNNLPFAVEVVANPFELKYSSKNIVIKLLMSIWNSELRNVCKKAIGVSYVTEHILQKYYPANKTTIQTFYSSIKLDKSFYYNERTFDIFKKQFIISHVTDTIESYNKGHITVIKIVKQLNDLGVNIKAVFAGDGSYVSIFKKEAMLAKVEDKIEFVGVLNRNEVRDFLIESDIMVFPTYSEGLPRVLLEAMATSLPCLSTPVGGIPEILDESLLFDPEDVDGFSNKIIEIISNKSIYENLSKKNYIKSLEYEDSILNARREKFFREIKQSIKK